MNKGILSAVLLLSCGLANSSQLAMPVWTYSTPSPAQISVTEGSTATVQYTVTNQSSRPKNLILRGNQPGLSA